MDDELFLNEPVEVLVVFGRDTGLCRPVKFRRASGREVVIKELGLRHPTHKGERTVHVFEVTDGGADYRLEFDSERLTWRLTCEADRYE
jgi:hypothetical protein